MVKETFALFDKKNPDKDVYIKFEIELDNMTLFLLKKGSDSIQRIIHKKIYTVSTETNIEDIIEDFYTEYLDRKSVENYWGQNLKFDGGVIEIDLDVDIEES